MSLRLQLATIENHEVAHKDGRDVMNVTAICRHAGVLTYRTLNGARRELVTPEFITALDSNDFPFMGQIAGAPVTHEHPQGLIRKDSIFGTLHTDQADDLNILVVDDAHQDAGSQRGRIVGKVDSKVKIYRDGNVEVTMEVDDPLTMDSIRSGEIGGVSMGYQCQVVPESGMWNGQPYTHKQTAPLKVDHLALVANPRAPQALITSFDSADDTDVAWSLREDQSDGVPVNIFVPKSDGCGGDCDCDDCGQKKKVENTDKRRNQELQMDGTTELVNIGGESRRIDSQLASALRADGVLHSVRFDGDDKVYWCDSTLVEALYNDGIIEPDERADDASGKCGRGWKGRTKKSGGPGCVRAGKKAMQRRIEKAKKNNTAEFARMARGMKSKEEVNKARSERIEKRNKEIGLNELYDKPTKQSRLKDKLLARKKKRDLKKLGEDFDDLIGRPKKKASKGTRSADKYLSKKSGTKVAKKSIRRNQKKVAKQGKAFLRKTGLNQLFGAKPNKQEVQQENKRKRQKRKGFQDMMRELAS